jgi:ferredoxin
MTVYQVRLLNPAIALDRTIEVPDHEYILDMAIAQGIMLPAGCRQGTCSACVVKVVSGEVDQSEQRFLRTTEIAAGYAVTCVAYALSDCTLETHQEGVLYKSSLYFSASSQETSDGT